MYEHNNFEKINSGEEIMFKIKGWNPEAMVGPNAGTPAAKPMVLGKLMKRQKSLLSLLEPKAFSKISTENLSSIS